MDDVNPGHKPPLYLYESDRNSGPTIEEVDSDTEPEFEKRRDHYPKKNDRDLAKFVVCKYLDRLKNLKIGLKRFFTRCSYVW